MRCACVCNVGLELQNSVRIGPARALRRQLLQPHRLFVIPELLEASDFVTIVMGSVYSLQEIGKAPPRLALECCGQELACESQRHGLCRPQWSSKDHVSEAWQVLRGKW